MPETVLFSVCVGWKEEEHLHVLRFVGIWYVVVRVYVVVHNQHGQMVRICTLLCSLRLLDALCM